MRKAQLLTVLVLFLLAVATMWGVILARGLEPRLGLDLQGGVNIILVPAPGQPVDDGILDQTVSIIRQRVDALGVAEPDIARQGDTVLVQLPGVADREEAEQVIGRTAQLQFRRVLEVIPPGTPEYDEAGEPCGTLLDAPPPPQEEVVLCQRTFEPVVDRRVESEELPHEQWTKYRLGPAALSGTDVADAAARVDPVSGITWHVELDLDREGARRFADITGELACEAPGAPTRQLAIVLDGVVESAPTMADEVMCGIGITGGTAIITTGGGQEDARQLALVLRTGALPIQLDFATSASVSPTLGRASLQAGLLAGVIGLVLVAVYMVALYRGIGVAAVIELAMFGVVILGALILLGEYVGYTLTLAGIAGVIVAIGIAADSSIIYRERYRDEIRAGRTVRTAAEHAFKKAWRTNLTGNTVAFLAAVILYFLAVGPVRGFAFALGMATVVDTILFGTFTRSLFSLVAQNRTLAMSPLIGLRAEVVAPDVVGADRAPAKPTQAKKPTRTGTP
jgi:preprotein translocase subunit SecD